MLESVVRRGISENIRQGMDWQGAGRALWQRKSSLAGIFGMLLIVGVALFAPWLAPHDPLRQELSKSLLPPMWEARGDALHLLGTDALGRDLLSRLLYGARYSLLISAGAALLGSGLGLLAGLVSGFLGGRVDALLMRLGDIQLAFPFILLAIVFLSPNPDRGVIHLLLVLGIPSWIIYGRVVRGRVLAEKGKDYVTAARSLGATPWRRLTRYIFPNVWQVIPAIAMLDLGFLIIIESMLSFLGFGLTPPTPSWGGILAEGKQYMIISPWMALFPGLAIMLTVLCVNLTADGLADFFDPKLVRGGYARYGTVKSAAPASQAATGGPLLQVRDLVTEFALPGQPLTAVRGISFDLDRGQALGVVGESGSGKSVAVQSVMRLLDPPGRIRGGGIYFDNIDLARADERQMAKLRGKHIGMIFQNPTTSLNPVLTIGQQIIETLRQHQALSRQNAQARAEAILRAVGIGDPARVLRTYPFQLSGGMNQRVMIALTMALHPDLLIADEPTTALDVTTQAQILDQLQAILQTHNTSMIFITHDIALLAGYVDTIVVLYAGQVCEIGPAAALLQTPRHPYTQALLNAIPRADLPADQRLQAIPGELPNPTMTFAGCPFAARCPHAMEICHRVNPARTVVTVPVTGTVTGDSRRGNAIHEVACHLNPVAA
jgi:peptide/nickel transport system permease protein